jgi:aconitate hydratase
METKLSWKATLRLGSETYSYISLPAFAEENGIHLEKYPFSIRILIENILRNYDGFSVTEAHIENILHWGDPKKMQEEIPYKPARVLMQDFTGVPAIVDIAALRAEMERKGKDPTRINPIIPVDLVIDHSVQVLHYGHKDAYEANVQEEYRNNRERYTFFKWAQQALQNFSVLPPGMGICHQVNLEFLAKVVQRHNGWAFPDTLVGTDSHTPMVNGIGVVGWGVGGIEAEAALLGQPIYMVMPEVIGLELVGQLPEGVTATDLVLRITELLRALGVVGKFVEVFGEGLQYLTVPDRATISNMSPEFGCTITYFPVDEQTLTYLRRTARSEEHVQFVEAYMKENGLWRTNEKAIQYTNVITLDLSTIEPSVSGPKRPQDRIPLKQLKSTFQTVLKTQHNRDYLPIEHRTPNPNGQLLRSVLIKTKQGEEFLLSDGSLVIAAITSCTNTSNPSVMLGAGLVAKKAVEKGLSVKPWVKTSLAPGSRVVTEYLEKSGLLPYLEALRFHVVGYGCTTCIGNSGPLPEPIAKAIQENNLVVASILSGNRNFEARIHPLVKMNFLASPMLVVAYAIAGRIDIDIFNEPLAYTPDEEPVFLQDIWPSMEEIAQLQNQILDPKDFQEIYSRAYEGDAIWKQLPAPTGVTFQWDPQSTYIKEPPFFYNISEEPLPLQDIQGARVLLLLGDSITTDHISPAGTIPVDSPAGQYLIQHGVEPKDFNSYGARRGNHEVMIRGTFNNVRLKNKLVDREGGWTLYHPTQEIMSVYDAAMKYQENGIPLLVIAGKEYGSGSSRDWAAKGTALLGIKAVIAESYERIHRSNLVGMGVLPLEFEEGENAESLGLKGNETYTISGIQEGLTPRKKLKVTATKPDGSSITFNVITRLDSEIEIAYYQHGGILHYVLRQFLKNGHETK